MKRMERVCPNTEYLARWVEAGLPAEERASLAAHLAGCDACRRVVALAATLEPAPPAAAVDEALLRRVVAASRRRPAWRWAAAAAALLAGALAVVLGRPSPAPEPPSTAAPRPVPVARSVPAPTPAVAPAPAPAPETLPVVVVPAPPPSPVAVPAPSPAPAAVPEPPKKDTAKVEPAPDPKPAPDAAPAPRAGATEVDLAALYAPVFFGDPSGDLWLAREGAEPAKAGAFEQVGWKDVASARTGASGFTLDARSTVVLDRAAAAALAWVKAEQAYRLEVREGAAVVDTDGAPQRWIVAAGRAQLLFTRLEGRLSVEPQADGVRAVLLEGHGELRAGAARALLQPGREVVLSADNRLEDRKATGTDRFAKLLRARPRQATVFEAKFDEQRRTVAQPFPYTIVQGRLVEGRLEAESAFVPSETSSVKPFPMTAALKPDRPILSGSDIVLKFRYRTTLTVLTVRLREPRKADGAAGAEYAVDLPSRSAGRWVDGEIPLGAFMHEGVPLVPLTDLVEVRFSGISEKKGGVLEFDAVQFLRRAR
jgi:ferric-dicitrate binding protein FerR (iron transport regulator)